MNLPEIANTVFGVLLTVLCVGGAFAGKVYFASARIRAEQDLSAPLFDNTTEKKK